MNLFLYCFEMLEILFFVAGLSICFFTYGLTRYRAFAVYGVFLLCCSAEVIYFGIINMIIGENDLVALDRAYTVPGAVFVLAELYLMQRAAGEACGMRISGWKALSLPVLFTALTLCLGFSDRVAAIAVGSSSYYLGMVCVAVVYFWVLRRKAADSVRTLLDKAAAILFVGEMLACVESVLYESVAWRFMEQYLPSYSYGLNFCDFFTGCALILTVILIAFRCRQNYLDNEVERRVREEVELMQVAVAKEQENPIDAFAERYGLTERETEVVECLIRGCSNQDIAEELYISVGTVRTHMRNIMEKLEVNARGQVVGKYIAYRK